jgi:hypothetical protein
MPVIIATGIIASWTLIVGWAVFSRHGYAFDRSAVLAMATFIGLVAALWVIHMVLAETCAETSSTTFRELLRTPKQLLPDGRLNWPHGEESNET